MTSVGLRESINNLIRSDRPESPTDLVFIVGSLVLLALQVYATQARCTVPHMEMMLLALGSYKVIKVTGSRTKGNENGSATPGSPAAAGTGGAPAGTEGSGVGQ